jgi:hypothetical protein
MPESTDPKPELLAMEPGDGERREIGRIRQADRLAANPAERADPE